MGPLPLDTTQDATAYEAGTLFSASQTTVDLDTPLEEQLSQFNAPEEKLAWLQEQKTLTEDLREELTGEMLATSNAIAAIDMRLEDVDAGIQALEKEQAESQLTPWFSVSAPMGKRLFNVQVQYGDMPEGVYAESLKNGSKYSRVELGNGSGTVNLSISWIWEVEQGIRLVTKESISNYPAVEGEEIITFTTNSGYVQEEVDSSQRPVESLTTGTFPLEKQVELAKLKDERETLLAQRGELLKTRDAQAAEIGRVDARLGEIDQNIAQIEEELAQPDPDPVPDPDPDPVPVPDPDPLPEEEPAEPLLDYLQRLAVERNQAEAVREQLAQEIAVLDQQIGVTQQEISDLEAKLEAGPQTPDCRFTAGRNSLYVYAAYHNLPADMQMQILSAGGAVKASKTLSMERNNDSLQIPVTSYDPNMQVRLWHPESGAVDESAVRLSVRKSNAMYAIDSGTRKLTSLASPWDEEELRAARDALLNDLALLELQKEDIEDQLASAEAELTPAQEALRNAVPYSKMVVEGTRIRYMTNLDWVEFKSHDGSTNVKSMIVDHAGGEADRSFNFDFPREHVGDKAEVGSYCMLDMLDREGNVLDRVQVYYNGRILTEQDAFEYFEKGRLSENPITPALRIAAIKANTVFFAVASSYDVSGVAIDGDGMRSSARLMHNGSAELMMGKVTLNAAYPAGTYMLRLFNKKGIELDGIPMNWNGAELSPKEESSRWGAFTQAQSTMGRGEEGLSLLALNAAEAKAAATVFEAQAGLPSTNVDGNVQLRRIQQSELYAKSSFVIPHEDIPAMVDARWPGLDPATRQGTIAGMTQSLGSYEEQVGCILQAAVDAMHKIQYQAVPENQALEEFHEIHSVYGKGPHFDELAAIGISLPSESETLREGQRLFEMETVINTLQYRQEELKRLYAIDNDRASSPEWQIAHGRAHPEEVTIAQTTDSEQRRLIRAITRAKEAIAYANDPRVKLLLASREQINSTFANYDGADFVLDPAVVDELAQREHEQMQDETVVRSVSEELAMVGDLTGILAVPEEDSENQPLVFGERLSAYIAQYGVRLTEAIREAFEQGAIKTEMESVALGEAESAFKKSVLARLEAKIGHFSNGLKWKAFETAMDLGSLAVRGVLNTYASYDQLQEQYRGAADAMANAVANAYEKAIASGIEKLDELLATAGLPPAFLTWCAVNDTDGYFDLVDRLGDVAVSWADARYGVDVGDQEGLERYHEEIGKVLENDASAKAWANKPDVAKELHNKLFLHQKGNTENAGKLVIIILGQGQELGDQEAGLYTIARAEAAEQGYEVLTFRVGTLASELTNDAGLNLTFRLHPEVVFQHTANVIQDRIARRGMFEGMPEVTKVSAKGYSWGGGVIDRLFGTEESTMELLGGIKPTALAYIDAVQHPFWGGYDNPVDRRPYCEYFYNAYQTNPGNPHTIEDPYAGELGIYYTSNPFRGDTVHGTFIAGAYNGGWDLYSNAIHSTIDEEAFNKNYGKLTPLDILTKFQE